MSQSARFPVLLLLVVILAYAVSTVGLGAMTGIVPRLRGLPEAEMRQLFILLPVMLLAGGLLGMGIAALAMLWGHRILGAAGLALAAVCFYLSFGVDGIPWWALPAVILAGAVVPLGLAEIGERWPGKSLGTAFAAILGGAALLSMIQSSVILFLNQRWQPIALGLAFVALIVAGAIFFTFAPGRPAPRPGEDGRFPWARSAFWNAVAGIALLALAGAAVPTWGPSLLNQAAPGRTGPLMMTLSMSSALAAILGFLAGGVASDLLAERRRDAYGLVAMAGALICGLGLLSLALTSGASATTAFLVLCSFASALVLAPIYAGVQQLCTSRSRALAIAFLVFAGLLAARIGFPVAWTLLDTLRGGRSIATLRPDMGWMAIPALWAAVHFWFSARGASAMPLRDDAANPADPDEEGPAPSGIGGWLILPAIGLPLGLLVSLFDLVTILQAGAFKEDGAMAGFFSLAAISDLALIVIGVIATILFFQKKRAAIGLICGLLIAGPVLTLALMIFGQGIPELGATTFTGDLIRGIAAASIWMPYFLLSRRVRATFVE